MMSPPRAETSAQLHAPQDAEQLLAALGGQEVIASFAEQSRHLANTINSHVSEGVPRSGQDSIYQGMGLKHLLAHSEPFKERFDALAASLVEVAKKRHYDVSFKAVPVKSFDAAQAKVNVDYHGDASRLSDAVRGTIYVNGNPGKETLRVAYGVLDAIINGSSTAMLAADAEFTSIKDRYQQPAGTYRDFLLLVRISGFCCELQVNLGAALEIKKKKQHQQYELLRMANRALLDAAMRGEPKMVRIILISECCDVNHTDAKGFSAMHYAARLGSTEMLEALLAADADPLLIDDAGRLPIFHAALMSHREALQQLLSAMESRTQLQLALLPDKAKSSLQSTQTLTNRLDAGLEKRVGELVAKALSHTDDQMHAAAHSGDARLCKLLLDDKGVWNTASWRFQPDVGSVCTGLDQAIVSGSVATVNVMKAAGINVYKGDDGELGPHTDFLGAAKEYARRGQPAQLCALIASVDEAKLPDMNEVVVVALQAYSFRCLYRLNELGFKLNVADSGSGVTLNAIHKAAGKNDRHAVKTLLQMGLSPNAMDDNKRTPLHVAAAGGFVSTLEVLIEAKGDVNSQLPLDKWTPALRAAQRGQSLAVKLLYEARADLTKSAPVRTLDALFEATPAWIAACNGHIHVLECIAGTDAKDTLKDPRVMRIASRSKTVFEYLKSVIPQERSGVDEFNRNSSTQEHD
jgi:ankyrin repeat protein